MGSRIAAFYSEAEAIAGLDGKIQLAMLTRIPSTRALIEPDSPQNLARFEGAIQAIRRSITPSSPISFSIPPGSSLAPSGRMSADVMKAHRPLPQGEELLWGVLTSLHDAMVAVYERNGQSLLAWESRALEKRYPMQGQEPLGPFIARSVGKELAEEIALAFDTGQTQQRDMCCTLGGHVVWLLVTLSSVHDERGQTLGVNAFIQDVSEQREHELQSKRREARLREHNRVFLSLLVQKQSFLSDLQATLRCVTEAAASTLSVARASVWFYEAERTEIVCADLFDVAAATHSMGLRLTAANYPAYFAALEQRGTIAASHAREDLRTSEFTESYLTPLGIYAMLDVPIWVHGEMVGVVCHEHLVGPREWETDEENFAHLMASFVALSKEVVR